MMNMMNMMTITCKNGDYISIGDIILYLDLEFYNSKKQCRISIDSPRNMKVWRDAAINQELEKRGYERIQDNLWKKNGMIYTKLEALKEIKEVERYL